MSRILEEAIARHKGLQSLTNMLIYHKIIESHKNINFGQSFDNLLCNVSISIRYRLHDFNALDPQHFLSAETKIHFTFTKYNIVI
jgi:hypothetical protein